MPGEDLTRPRVRKRLASRTGERLSQLNSGECVVWCKFKNWFLKAKPAQPGALVPGAMLALPAQWPHGQPQQGRGTGWWSHRSPGCSLWSWCRRWSAPGSCHLHGAAARGTQDAQLWVSAAKQGSCPHVLTLMQSTFCFSFFFFFPPGGAVCSSENLFLKLRISRKTW